MTNREDRAARDMALCIRDRILALAPVAPSPAPDAWCACGERLRADGTCPLEPRGAPKESK